MRDGNLFLNSWLVAQKAQMILSTVGTPGCDDGKVLATKDYVDNTSEKGSFVTGIPTQAGSLYCADRGVFSDVRTGAGACSCSTGATQRSGLAGQAWRWQPWDETLVFVQCY